MLSGNDDETSVLRGLEVRIKLKMQNGVDYILGLIAVSFDLRYLRTDR